MADTIEQLKDKLQALEADSGGNKDRKKLEVALEFARCLSGPHEAWCRAVRRPGHRSDERPVRRRIVFAPKRCKPWPSSGLHRKPRRRRRRRVPGAWPRGDRCVSLRVSGYRARLESMRSALPPPPPKKGVDEAPSAAAAKA